jgi:crotonobetainyl-CoA:carnitine CoA-transferase CaiB-like acyl-CoA transferase
MAHFNSNNDEFPAPLPRPADAETPLPGTRVIDFTHYIAGPFATMMLGDFGADVIKIESPGRGDHFRHYPPAEPDLNGEGSPFLWTNRNKRSVAIDLKSEQGLALVRKLIASADVLVENFSSGVMDRLGIGYAVCKELNPRLVFCSIAAYSRSGEFSDRLGFDPVLQAESGFIDTNGYPDRDGVRTAASTMDIATAMMATNAVLAALLARERTGKGQYVELSLHDTAILMTGFQAMQHLFSGSTPQRFGNTSPDTAPTGVFHSKDKPFYISSSNTQIFQRLFAQVVNRPDIANDPELATGAGRIRRREELFAVLNDAFATQPWEYWKPKLRAAGVAAGQVRTVSEALRSPETRDRHLVTKIPHPTAGTVPNIALPFRFSMTPVADPVAAPLLGQHTVEVLSETLGMSAAGIEDLARSGAFGAQPALRATGAANAASSDCQPLMNKLA